MCGIAGIVLANGRGDAEGPLQRMLQALDHRGPDDRGSVLFDHADHRVGLAAARLAIRDLSPAGHQPMRDAHGHVLVYNGELYDVEELRTALGEQTGEPWRSHSDTEVLLRGLATRGPAFLDRVRGMFAFAFWDPAAGSLTLGRDPFGIKPLYAYQADGLLLFASEVRALLASGLVPRRLSPDGVRSYLGFGSVEDPRTAVEGVAAVPAGHRVVASWSGGALHTRIEGHDLAETAPARTETRTEAAHRIGLVLERSVAAHLASDVPVAAFLSGGIDSTALVVLMGRATRERPHTFTVAFPDDPSSEGRFARAVADTLGTAHHEVALTEDEAARLLPDALASLDQPSMDAFNSYVVSRAVAGAGIKVALSGLGGDELFGGYPSFRRTTPFGAALPALVRQATARTVAWMTSGLPRLGKVAEGLRAEGGPLEAYLLSRRLFAPADVATLAGAPVAPSLPPVPEDGDAFAVVSRLEMGHYMRNTLLRDTDATSMSLGLEVRVPFVDRRVVEAVRGVPAAFQSDGTRPKPLLLDALAGAIPEFVWKRPKQGFTLPLERWMRGRLRPEIESVLSDAARLRDLGLDPAAALGVWRRFLRHPAWVGWTRPWALFVLARWGERHGLRS